MREVLTTSRFFVLFGVRDTPIWRGRQNRAQLSDVALANIEALANAELTEGCDNTTPGVCWNEETIVFPYGFTGLACIFTNDLDVYCTGNYVDPTTGQWH